MKIAFVQAPAWGRDCPPYTMCFFAALVRQKKHQAFLFDLNNILYHSSAAELRKMWDDKDYYAYWENNELVCAFLEKNKMAVDFYVDKILATKARLIGFTVHFSSVWASLEIAKKIKEKDKRRTIVFGGPDCSRQQKGDFLIRQDCVDIVVYGEGEAVIFDIINKIDNFRDAKDGIKGCLILKDADIIDGGYRPPIFNLDKLPLPDYTDFKDDINLRMYKEPRRLDVFDSRGCPSCCHFCSEWQFWGKFRFKSGRKIYEEIAAHMRDFPRVNYFYFAGSLVNGNLEALGEFCDLAIKNKLAIQWAGQAIIRPEMTRDFLRKMKESGCIWISYGIESGSQKVLNKMNKRFSVEVAERVLKNTYDAGIPIQANFMFGLPTETLEDFDKTLYFLKENRKFIDTILASQSFCVIDKGTYLYNKPQEFGIINRKHHLYWESNNGENNYPERLDRYEEFCRIALSLGVPETSGVLKNKPDKWHLLGDYYFYLRNYKQAIENYKNAEASELPNRFLLGKLSECCQEIGDYVQARNALNRALQIKSPVVSNGSTEQAINIKKDFLDRLSGVLEKFNRSAGDSAYHELSSIDSKALAVILRNFSRNKFQDIDLNKLVSVFDFNEKQRSISQALYSHEYWEKLSNFILADVQKARKEIILYGYPYWLVIDPCNYCNLRCPFCPTGQDRKVRAKAKLSFNDFKYIIDKLGPYLIHVDLVNWGEPLLNEDIFEMIKYAKKYNLDVKIDTNLNHLDEKKAERLVLSGLDKIVVSIDGLTEDTYGKYRKGGNFKAAMDNLQLLVRKRRELKSKKPYITWQFLVFRHNEHEVDKAIGLGRRIGVDHVGITKAFIGEKDWIPLNPEYSNYNTEKINSKELTYNHFKTADNLFCNWPWEAVAINSNGSVSPCCSSEEEKDDFGVITDQPFEELWNSKEYRVAREYNKEKKLAVKSDKNICIGCRHLGLINVDIMSCHSFFE